MRDLAGNEDLRRYASIRIGGPVGMPLAVVHIGHEETTIVSGNGEAPEALLALNIGAHKTAREYFKHEPPTPSEMENAIMNVEDELARARTTILDDCALFTNDAAIRKIALLAGLANQPVMHFGLAEVETTFDRLVSVLYGRPASAEGLPTNPGFAATLLILREFMHHLKFSLITVMH